MRIRQIREERGGLREKSSSCCPFRVGNYGSSCTPPPSKKKKKPTLGCTSIFNGYPSKYNKQIEKSPHAWLLYLHYIFRKGVEGRARGGGMHTSTWHDQLTSRQTNCCRQSPQKGQLAVFA